MPKLLDPTCTFEVVLAGDMDKPEDKRPTFVFRALSVRQFTAIAELHDTLEDLPSDSKRMNAVVDSLRQGMTGWRNMGRDFDLDAIADLLTIGEAIELLQHMLAGQQLNGPDAKN